MVSFPKTKETRRLAAGGALGALTVIPVEDDELVEADVAVGVGLAAVSETLFNGKEGIPG